MIDVVADPAGREKLLAYGVRNVPVIARGDQYVFGQNLEDVAKFVGLQGTGHQPLPPEQLTGKWLAVLRSAQRLIRQMPAERLHELAISNRPRTIRFMGHHVFRIAEAYLETVVDGVDYDVHLANLPPAEGEFNSGDEIARYGDAIIARLEHWWNGLAEADKSCQRTVTTYFGVQPVHMLYERSTWHSAQHTRQLAAVLERFGIKPDGPPTSEELAGLPLPERLWE